VVAVLLLAVAVIAVLIAVAVADIKSLMTYRTDHKLTIPLIYC